MQVKGLLNLDDRLGLCVGKYFDLGKEPSV